MMEGRTDTIIVARQIAATFGCEIEGLTVDGHLSQGELSRIINLLHQYRFVLIRCPDLKPADLVAFSRAFGELEIHSNTENTLPCYPEVYCIGNIEHEGIRAAFTRGVEQWHADSSFRNIPSDASLLYGVIVPSEGGETIFADATAAYDALSAQMKQNIEMLRAVHSLETLYEWNRQFNPGWPDYTDHKRAAWPPVIQDLVRTHPVTNRKSLYLCPAVISHIEGMSAEAGRLLIHQLMAHTAQTSFTYKHAWKAGDLVMWDNRAVLHTASLYDSQIHKRLMYRTTIAGRSIGVVRQR